jgi:CRISPR/Cas system CSM-associated protein Csm3 (group 7 of RAMP superfamily)
MPETLKRPFDFVPLPYGAGIDRHRPSGHDVFDGESGRLECRLEALSPLLVMDSDNRAGSSSSDAGKFMTGQDGDYLIPGASLKGVVRSLFEVIVPSCVSMIDNERMIDAPFTPCTSYDQLCPACRTFGFMSRGRSGGRVHRGHVNIGEARVLGTASRGPDRQLIPLFGPNPDSDHYQESSSGRGGGRRAKGRKFYFHQDEVQTATTQNERERGPYVAPLEPGSTFAFTVTYQNLSREELSGLVAALELTEDADLEGEPVDVRHKLGYGKPAGLGSAAIRITEAKIEPSPGERYSQFNADADVLTGEELRSWVEEKKEPVFGAPSEAVSRLIEILRYPAPEEVTYTYYPHGRDF